MRDRLLYFAFWPGDFSSDVHVEAMTTEQVGAYILLLCKAWQGDPPGSLPSDAETLARYARVSFERWLEIKDRVLAPFAVGIDGRLYSERLQEEYALASQKSGKASESANKRWGNANAMLSDQTRTDKKKTPLPPFPTSLDTPAFREAWAEWLDDRRQRRKTVTPRAAKMQFKILEPLGPELAIACIHDSIRNGYQGLFPERVTGRKPAPLPSPEPPLVGRRIDVLNPPLYEPQFRKVPNG